MYFGGLVLTKYIDKKYKNKVLKINIVEVQSFGSRA